MSSWLSKALGTNSIDMDFNYDPAMADVPGMNFANTAQDQLAISRQLLSGQGSYFDQQRQGAQDMISRGIADASSTALSQQNRALAARGMGGGGLRDLMSATSSSQAAEQIGSQMASFNLGLSQQGFQQAGTFAGIGAQFSSQALQQAVENARAQNEATQFELTSSYNQAAANKAARGQFFGNVMSLASGPLTAAFS